MWLRNRKLIDRLAKMDEQQRNQELIHRLTDPDEKGTDWPFEKMITGDENAPWAVWNRQANYFVDYPERVKILIKFDAEDKPLHCHPEHVNADVQGAIWRMCEPPRYQSISCCDTWDTRGHCLLRRLDGDHKPFYVDLRNRCWSPVVENPKPIVGRGPFAPESRAAILRRAMVPADVYDDWSGDEKEKKGSDSESSAESDDLNASDHALRSKVHKAFLGLEQQVEALRLELRDLKKEHDKTKRSLRRLRNTSKGA